LNTKLQNEDVIIAFTFKTTTLTRPYWTITNLIDS